MSTAKAADEQPTPRASDARVRWEGLADLETYRSMGKPFVSRGHFSGPWRAEVFTSAGASETYAGLTRATRFALGATVAERHTEAQTAAPGPIFVMIKREPGFFPEGGNWEYLVADAVGWVEDRGALAACARCHAEAEADWIFGPPVHSQAAPP